MIKLRKDKVNMEHVAGAIALAIRMHLEETDRYENMILTIQQVVRPYSPWSSKIYGLRQVPPRITVSKTINLTGNKMFYK